MATSPIPRPGARVILIDAADRLLLIKFRLENAEIDAVWVTPGGGLESEETAEQAAIRELREEVGLEGVTLGPCVWLRRHVLPWMGEVYELRERYFVCRIHAYEVGDHVNEDELEREWVTGHRWWSLSEIAASNEVFVPRTLADLLPPLLKGEYPDAPFEVGI
ncbi:MAG TPA: NUDIX domain-containing protein [Dehalococcoidia bacterium]|nr:NUDIX domain-containing protein [Dehalococcoidia bacterium]